MTINLNKCIQISADKLFDSSQMSHFGSNSNDSHKYMWSKIVNIISETERGAEIETENTEKQGGEPRDKHERSQLGLQFADLSTLPY